MARIARNEALQLVRPPRAGPLEGTAEPAGDSHEAELLEQPNVERAIAGLAGLDRALVRGSY